MPSPCLSPLLCLYSILCLECHFLHFLPYLNLIHSLRPRSNFFFLKPFLPTPVHSHHVICIFFNDVCSCAGELRVHGASWSMPAGTPAYAFHVHWRAEVVSEWHSIVLWQFGVGQSCVQILTCHFPTGCKTNLSKFHFLHLKHRGHSGLIDLL